MNDAKNKIPLNPVVFSILYVLIGKTFHGYRIKKKVEADIESKVATATLYRHLRRMLEDGMIEEVEMDIEDDDPRRQYFRLTKFGSAVYAAEYNRLREIVDRGLGVPEPVLGGA